MERYVAKIVSLVIIFASILIATMLPIRVEGFFARQGARGRAVLGAIRCFSGGLFLATYLLDMAPAVRELLQETLMDRYAITYPVPELIIGAGFFLILLMEIIVMSLSSSRRREARPDPVTFMGMANANPVLDADWPDMTMVVNIDPKINCGGNSLSPGNGVSGAGGHWSGSGRGDARGGPARGGDGDDRSPWPGGAARSPGNGAAHHTNVCAAGGGGERTTNNALTAASAKEDQERTRKQEETRVTRSIILVLALSLDSIFEGMALGLKTTMQGVWNLLIAIVAHEVVIAFSMGMQLIRHQTRRSVAIIAILYSLMSPIGGAVGATLMETQGRSFSMDMTNGILQGLTAGIFIYVTFFEILSTEFVQGVTYTRITTTFLGFCVMAALKAIPDGSEAVRHMAANGTDTG